MRWRRRARHADQLWERPDGWHVCPTGCWTAGSTWRPSGLASAILSAAALLELEAVLIDGWMPADVRAALSTARARRFCVWTLPGLTAPPVIREGTVGPQARELGGAALPLSQRFLVDQTAGLRTA